MEQTTHTSLAQFREEATSNRDLGERFLGPYPDVMPTMDRARKSDHK